MGALMTLLLVIKLSAIVMRHRQEHRTNRFLAAQQVGAVVELEMEASRSERSEVVNKEEVPISSENTATTCTVLIEEYVNSPVDKETVVYSVEESEGTQFTGDHVDSYSSPQPSEDTEGSESPFTGGHAQGRVSDRPKAPLPDEHIQARVSGRDTTVKTPPDYEVGRDTWIKAPLPIEVKSHTEDREIDRDTTIKTPLPDEIPHSRNTKALLLDKETFASTSKPVSPPKLHHTAKGTPTVSNRVSYSSSEGALGREEPDLVSNSTEGQATGKALGPTTVNYVDVDFVKNRQPCDVMASRGASKSVEFAIQGGDSEVVYSTVRVGVDVKMEEPSKHVDYYDL